MIIIMTITTDMGAMVMVATQALTEATQVLMEATQVLTEATQVLTEATQVVTVVTVVTDMVDNITANKPVKPKTTPRATKTIFK